MHDDEVIQTVRERVDPVGGVDAISEFAVERVEGGERRHGNVFSMVFEKCRFPRAVKRIVEAAGICHVAPSRQGSQPRTKSSISGKTSRKALTASCE